MKIKTATTRMFPIYSFYISGLFLIISIIAIFAYFLFMSLTIHAAVKRTALIKQNEELESSVFALEEQYLTVEKNISRELALEKGFVMYKNPQVITERDMTVSLSKRP